MVEKYELVSQKDAVRVREMLDKGMGTGNRAYDTYFFRGYEDGERLFLTRDDQTKIIFDCPTRRNFVIVSRDNNEQTKKVRQDLVKLLRKNTKVSIRKSRK